MMSEKILIVEDEKKAAAFLRDVAEEEILQALVLGWIRVQGVEEGGVNAGGLWAGDVVEAEGTEVGDFEFFGDGAVGFLLFEDGSYELFEVGVEG